MKRLLSVLTALGLVFALASPVRAEVSRGEIVDAIEAGVAQLVSHQAEDGHWPYAPVVRKGIINDHYALGCTALAVLALQHSRSKSTKAHMAIKKGLTYILQQPPESNTYTAGCVLQALYFDSPRKHRKLIGAYTWMLCYGQKADGVQMGVWSYSLPKLPPNWVEIGLGVKGIAPSGGGDNSNSQFGILGLIYAQKAGFQVPRYVWERSRDYYTGAQHQDGGWDYRSDAYRKSQNRAVNKRSTHNMTFAGTVSIYMCEEMLADKRHLQCVAPPVNESHEAGLKWIAERWSSSLSAYGWYACERLGILIGYSEFGGHDWYQEGARNLIPGLMAGGGGGGKFTPNTAFAVLFLSRGLSPIIINKLKRDGDWNLHRYDLKNLVEHLSGPWQHPSQWRIVTLDATVDFMLRVPILWISGHDALTFNAEEKAKLKEYVERGGTILGEACCGKKEFDASFRELLKELWPDTELRDLPQTHPIYTSFRKLTQKPALMALPLKKGQGRLGVIYIPHGMSCKWEVAGPGSQPWLDVGACIYLYIDQMNRRLRPKTVAPREAMPAVKKIDDFVDGFGEAEN